MYVRVAVDHLSHGGGGICFLCRGIQPAQIFEFIPQICQLCIDGVGTHDDAALVPRQFFRRAEQLFAQRFVRDLAGNGAEICLGKENDVFTHKR